MNKLMPLEFKNQRIMLTKVLADEFGTDDKIIQQNFKRNEGRFTKGKHYYRLTGDELKEFKANLHLEGNLKFASELILWTDRGAARHAKILDTDEAWEVYETLEESYFKPKAQIPKLSKELQAIFTIDERTVELDNRVTVIEERMTIETGKQKVLCDLVNGKVIAILGGKESPAYKELGKKAFRQCWNDYKTALNVASYKDTAIKDFDLGKQTIINWKPNRELELMIKGCNSPS
ncbi:ORF6C domain-containing protein [Clostridium beijerinckii]|uniref:ORF6C domain-containing protein n=1 Tax=Clostridium beijerinckii TaxID=1520 RepID=UPI001361F1EA|nr:ORF6C domain-containing protein [Clostridium beijerinckii]MZK53501.1 hypothetical protein [Clostridium beijerinckii]MZK61639.1 hypothetical protein [Clostridium beijerinckii]MZK71864.1 hypothetical protein [Clostridium beijerinckii]MZK77268.1 hypothetical protein [Clostridium beijerinckii]MZK86347.1 hypothetical protein [Clostridium beijerinckii]